MQHIRLSGPRTRDRRRNRRHGGAPNFPLLSCGTLNAPRVGASVIKSTLSHILSESIRYATKLYNWILTDNLLPPKLIITWAFKFVP